MSRLEISRYFNLISQFGSGSQFQLRESAACGWCIDSGVECNTAFATASHHLSSSNDIRIIRRAITKKTLHLLAS